MKRNKIIIASLALLILALLYFFQKTDENPVVTQSLSYTEKITTPIYLLDNNDYVARTDILKKDDEPFCLSKFRPKKQKRHHA